MWTSSAGWWSCWVRVWKNSSILPSLGLACNVDWARYQGWSNCTGYGLVWVPICPIRDTVLFNFQFGRLSIQKLPRHPYVGTPATARIFHPLSITSFGWNVPDWWCSVKMITDTFFMMGKIKRYSHFCSEKLLMLIVTQWNSTCVGAAVEVWEEHCEPEGCCFCFLLL